MKIFDHFKRKQKKQHSNMNENLTLRGDEFEIIKIEYVVLFDWQERILGQPVIRKVCIDTNNGTFYLLTNGELYPISDKRFTEIIKKISNKRYAQYKDLPQNKTDFINNCTTTRYTFNYKNRLFDLIRISDGVTELTLKRTSYSGWILHAGTKELILGDRYFYESTINDFLNIIKKHIEQFDSNVIISNSEILKQFGLIGDCGYAPLQLMGTGYEKDPYRNHTDSVTYKFENGVLYISGQGATSERHEGGDCGRCCSEPEHSVFCKYILDNTVKVVFGKGITKIGKYFLSDFKKLDEIVLSDTVEIFEKQNYGTTFKRAPIKRIYMYRGQKQPFGDHVEIQVLEK